MPHGPAHKTKLKKNIAVALGILGFIALVWLITVVRISGNIAANPPG